MGHEFEFLSASDKPALLGIGSLEWQARALAALDSLGFKVHAAQSADDFITRFTQVPYQVVIIEELFDAALVGENRALQYIQSASMNLRRHAAIILLGDSFQTLNTMQAFAQSVHAVVAGTDLDSLDKIIAKVVADNDLFLTAFRQVQEQIAKGKQ